jgi:hypothetical protein
VVVVVGVKNALLLLLLFAFKTDGGGASRAIRPLHCAEGVQKV